MKTEETHIFPSERADSLDNKFRKLLQNPVKILNPLVKKGMTVLDYGCGNGFFTLPLAKIVGNDGKVYAVDIQREMLEKLTHKLSATKIKNVFQILIGFENLPPTETVDFVIAINVVHEIPDKKNFFKEMYGVLKPGGKLLVVEPAIIVSRRKFNFSMKMARHEGFVEYGKSNILFSKSRVLIKENSYN